MNLKDHLKQYGIEVVNDSHADPAPLSISEELKNNFRGLIDIVKTGDCYTVFEAVEMSYPDKVHIVQFGEYSDVDSVCGIIYKHFFN
jgi:hypothetical protein